MTWLQQVIWNENCPTASTSTSTINTVDPYDGAHATNSASLICGDQQNTFPVSSKFQCSICYKILKGQRALKLHEDKHRGIYQVHCDLCGKGFYNSNDLRGHKAAKHDMQKEYQCQYCSKLYSCSKGLKMHVLTKH